MDSEGIDADRLAIVASPALLPFVLEFGGFPFSLGGRVLSPIKSPNASG
jgi:hypothetical protein